MVCDDRLIAVGISHHTANVEDRERIAVAPDLVPGILGRLRDDGFSSEAILLSTCNRTELYTVPGSRGDVDRLARFLAESGGVTDKSLADKIYKKRDQEALRHIFRVASSLDSLVLGEPQIVGQMKTALRLAQKSNAAGPMLHREMDHALRVSKRVRTETDISREAVSVGRAGVELAKQVLGTLEGRSALLVGAGEHGKIVARALVDFGLDEIVVANRTFERAAALADMFNGSAIPLQEVDRYLPRVDIVLCSTGAGRNLISRDDVTAGLSKRRGRSLVMIDLAVPRNIDPSVNELSGVFRFDIDDLATFAGRGQAARRDAAEVAEGLVEEATELHWRQLMGEQVNRELGRIVHGAEQIRQSEVERILTVLEGLPADQRRAVEAMTRAIVKKVLHQPLRQVRDWAEQGDIGQAKTIFTAFGAEAEDDD
jgi:glutamyl-tRNA reductase